MLFIEKIPAAIIILAALGVLWTCAKYGAWNAVKILSQEMFPTDERKS
jgi:hypothetical protein